MKKLSAATLCAVLLLAVITPSRAAITEPVITATIADTNTMTLLVKGFNLQRGAVYMGKSGGGVSKLQVIRQSATTIEARLPSADAGTYIVAIALSASQFWASTVTIGSVGPQGPQGPQGPPGLSGYRHETHLFNFSLAPGEYFFGMECQGGEKVVSGGMYGGSSNVVLNGSYPQTDLKWLVHFTITGSTNQSISASLICATPAP